MLFHHRRPEKQRNQEYDYDSYDPFSFQQQQVRKGRKSVTTTSGPPQDLSASQQRRVPSVMTPGRQFANSFGLNNVIDDSSTPVFHNGDVNTSFNGKPVRRNMLMNIILRPGGGDKNRALPRPKVDVKAQGANVIIVKMTFPNNENIQGLRAYTPTDPRELDQFADIGDLVPVGSSISKIVAKRPNKFFFDAETGQIRKAIPQTA